MTIALSVLVRALAADALPRAPEADRERERDAALVRACLAGDRRAFDALYRHHAAVVHRRLARLVGRADADDLLQHVFLEAFRSLRSFRGDAAFATWLHRIAIHAAMRELRRRRRHPSADAALDDAVAVADPGLSPEDRARQAELCARALRYLDALAPKHRIAFVLRHVEEMSLQEIGALVGAEAPAVGQRVKKAEQVLLARIARDEQHAKRTREATP
jgi:RNA polymerase sigma-70 factor, ECF subfamily